VRQKDGLKRFFAETAFWVQIAIARDRPLVFRQRPKFDHCIAFRMCGKFMVTRAFASGVLGPVFLPPCILQSGFAVIGLLYGNSVTTANGGAGLRQARNNNSHDST